MMELRFAPPDSRKLDEIRADALVLPFFSEERPLRGPAGLIDWRLRGLLSKLRLRGRLTGRALETVLVPGRPLTSFDKIFLLGLGPEEDLGAAQAETACRTLLRILDHALVRSAVAVLPGRSTGKLSAESALEIFLRASAGPHEQDSMTVIEDGDLHRTLHLTLERERRKARAASPG